MGSRIAIGSESTIGIVTGIVTGIGIAMAQERLGIGIW
jgi:hypothetical protein